MLVGINPKGLEASDVVLVVDGGGQGNSFGQSRKAGVKPRLRGNRYQVIVELELHDPILDPALEHVVVDPRLGTQRLSIHGLQPTQYLLPILIAALDVLQRQRR